MPTVTTTPIATSERLFMAAPDEDAGQDLPSARTPPRGADGKRVRRRSLTVALVDGPDVDDRGQTGGIRSLSLTVYVSRG
ncbi:hypothetical protein GCM10010182_04530 [Actinomadura cremea]|nr:hypothetical protein GCM10010182_04530 [Actinomadura cremea]